MSADSFIKTDDSLCFDSEIFPGDIKKRKKKAVKKQKKNKPKKAMTPFMVFSKENRKLLVAENPAMTFSEIGKELGARWRALTEEDKKIYVIKANQDYQRFLDEIEQLESSDPSKKRKTVEQKRQTKVKKSISAYLYFCNAHREQVKAQHPDMKMVEIQRLLAEKWMNSPSAVRIPFEKQAEADREKYNADISEDVPEPERENSLGNHMAYSMDGRRESCNSTANSAILLKTESGDSPNIFDHSIPHYSNPTHSPMTNAQSYPDISLKIGNERTQYLELA